MDWDQYTFHMSLAGYLAPPRSRLGALRSEAARVRSTFCGLAQILVASSQKGDDEVAEVHDVIQDLQIVCDLLRLIHENLMPSGMPPKDDDEMLLMLDGYRQRYAVVQLARSLSKKMFFADAQLRRILPNLDFWLSHIDEQSQLLWACFDMLVSPEPPDVLSEAIAFDRVLREIAHQANYQESNSLTQFIRASEHPMAYFRTKAAVALRHISDERAFEALLQLVGDDHEEVAAEAANSLGNRGDRRAVAVILARLEQGFEYEAYIGWMGSALAAMPDSTATVPLIQALDDLMKKPLNGDPLLLHPTAGLIAALKAIGGAVAENALRGYFGPEIV